MTLYPFSSFKLYSRKKKFANYLNTECIDLYLTIYGPGVGVGEREIKESCPGPKS